MSQDIPSGWTEVRGPELFKFETKGQELRGILLQGKNETIKGENGPEKVLEVYLQTSRGVVKFRPGYDVKQKLSKNLLGKELIIRYIGEDATVGVSKGNAMKIFGVYVNPGDPEGGDEITDADIPF